MAKKLTITVDDEVYAALHRVIGRRKISRCLNDLARPQVLQPDLAAGCQAMAADEEREREAAEWVEARRPTAPLMSANSPPRRGEVWWVAFDPSVGGEMRKTRPAVVVSNDVANRTLDRIQAVPLTSNVERLYPAEAYVTLDGERKAMADQLTAISRLRLRDRAGRLSPEDMAAVERAIRVQLGR